MQVVCARIVADPEVVHSDVACIPFGSKLFHFHVEIKNTWANWSKRTPLREFDTPIENPESRWKFTRPESHELIHL